MDKSTREYSIHNSVAAINRLARSLYYWNSINVHPKVKKYGSKLTTIIKKLDLLERSI